MDTKDKTIDQVREKITVNGQEIEVTKEELISLAQQGKHYTQSMQELRKKEDTLKEQSTQVAGLKSIVDEMESNPKLKESLNKVYSDFKSGKISKSEDTKDRNLNKLDKLIEETSDPAQREQLRDIREIIKEEAPLEDVKNLKEEIKAIKEELYLVKNAALTGQNDKVESQLQKLEERFGADLVNKYKENVKATALKYPNQVVSKIFYHFADDSEIETAILNQVKKKEKEILEQKKRNSLPFGSDTSFAAKTPLEKDKRTGRITFGSLKQRVLERLGKA